MGARPGRSRHAILNGRLVSVTAARIPVADRGFLAGDGAFETLRADGGTVALLAPHLERLADGLEKLRIEPAWSHAQLEAFVAKLLTADRLTARTARVRITVTRGTPEATSTLLVSAEPYEPPSRHTFGRGVAVEISRWKREPHPLHNIKSTSYLPNLLLRREASREDIFEVLQFNTAGRLAEGSFTNVFLVDAGGTLHTPRTADGCLGGVARGAVLSLTRQAGWKVIEDGIDRAQLQAASEVFLTNSLIEVLPVRMIDGRDVANGKPGPVTREIAAAYALRIRNAVLEV